MQQTHLQSTVPAVGWATQELAEPADRALADKLIACMYAFKKSGWDGKHSCRDEQADMPWFFLSFFVRHFVEGEMLRRLVQCAPTRIREISVSPSTKLPGVSTDLICIRLELLKESHCSAAHLHPGQRVSPHLDGSEASYCPLYAPPSEKAAHRGVSVPVERFRHGMYSPKDEALIHRACFLVYNMNPQLGEVSTDIGLGIDPATGKAPLLPSYKLFFNGVDELRYSFIEYLFSAFGGRIKDVTFRCEGASVRELEVVLLSERSLELDASCTVQWPIRKVISSLAKVKKDADAAAREQASEPPLRWGRAGLFSGLFDWIRKPST